MNITLTHIAHCLCAALSLACVAVPLARTDDALLDGARAQDTQPAEYQWSRIELPADDALYGVTFDGTMKGGLAVGWGNSETAVLLTNDNEPGAWKAHTPSPESLLFAAVCTPTGRLVAVGHGQDDRALVATREKDATEWKLQSLGASFGLYDVQFMDGATGYTCGYDGAIFKTTDGGLNWSALKTGTDAVFKNICFIDTERGFALAGGPFGCRSVYHTTNGGECWSESHDFGETAAVASFDFLDAKRGIAVGYIDGKNSIMRTTDGGKTWKLVQAAKDGVHQAVHFRGETGWAVGTGSQVFVTSDGGETWRAIAAPKAGQGLLSVSTLKDGVVAGGTDGALHRLRWSRPSETSE